MKNEIRDFIDRSDQIIFINIRRVLYTTVFICYIMLAFGQEGSSGKLTKPDQTQYRAQMHGWAAVDSDTSKWHPEKFYIIYPDTRTIFKLPHEEKKSGVRNLLFLNKKTGKTYLLDEERPLYEYRKFTQFGSEKYDVILLYNNGTYIRLNDVIFEKDSCMYIDMTRLDIQPSGSESEEWLKMRAFNDIIGDAKRKIKIKKDTTTSVSEVEIRGYVFDEKGECLPWLFIFSNSNHSKSNLLTISENDGYFRVESNNSNQSLHISSGQIYVPCEINVAVDCGIFVVLGRNPNLDQNIRVGNN